MMSNFPILVVATIAIVLFHTVSAWVHFPYGASILSQQPQGSKWSSGSGSSSRGFSSFSSYNYTTEWFTQTLDHYSFEPSGYKTFQQRYLRSDDHWNGPGWPLLVYLGNEGPIDWFCNNTGFLWETAEELNAMVLCLEHRYYGETLPYGADTFANDTTTAHLTSEQALADYAVILTTILETVGADNPSRPATPAKTPNQATANQPTTGHSPIIVLGGSYGGMLAQWFRLKYPHIAAGALSASAPTLQFHNIEPPLVDGTTLTFSRIVSAAFGSDGIAGGQGAGGSAACCDALRKGMIALQAAENAPGGLQDLTKQFGFCDTVKQGEIDNWVNTAITYAPMVNYPVPANFLMPLPAFPVATMCKAATTGDKTPLEALRDAASVYYNSTGSVQCFTPGGEDPHHMLQGWSVQSSTEMIMSTGIPDNSTKSQCLSYPQLRESKYTPNTDRQRPDWVPQHYGGRNIQQALQQFGSNIIFSNGLLDPWSAGSVLQNISDAFVTINIPGGAHHYDLRGSHPDDPQWIKDVRTLERTHIRDWVTAWNFQKSQTAPLKADRQTRITSKPAQRQKDIPKYIPHHSATPTQVNIPRVEKLPSIPSPFYLVDFKWKSLQLFTWIFQSPIGRDSIFTTTVKMSSPYYNGSTMFALPSYLTAAKVASAPGEALTSFGSVFGSLLAGISLESIEAVVDVQSMLAYVSKNGVVWNNPSGFETPQVPSFWYSLLNSVTLLSIFDLEPSLDPKSEVLRNAATAWYEASVVMGGSSSSLPNFNYTGFDFERMSPIYNGKWTEADAAAGVAWISYAAYQKFPQEEKFLTTAKWALGYLESLDQNPLFEAILPYAVYTAARMNAEVGTRFNVTTLLGWSLGDGNNMVRQGWGLIVDSWGGKNVGGLIGSITDGGGYGFFGNGAWFAAPIVASVKYAPEHARAVGKWMLHLASSSQYYFGGRVPDDFQSDPKNPQDPYNLIAYEGVRKCDYNRTYGHCLSGDNHGPFATGDKCENINCTHSVYPVSDRSLYGGLYVGILGAIVTPTNVSMVLQLDLGVTDFYSSATVEQYLLYNPLDYGVWVAVQTKKRQQVQLYNVLSEILLPVSMSHQSPSVYLHADSAAVLDIRYI